MNEYRNEIIDDATDIWQNEVADICNLELKQTIAVLLENQKLTMLSLKEHSYKHIIDFIQENYVQIIKSIFMDERLTYFANIKPMISPEEEFVFNYNTKLAKSQTRKMRINFHKNTTEYINNIALIKAISELYKCEILNSIIPAYLGSRGNKPLFLPYIILLPSIDFNCPEFCPAPGILSRYTLLY